MCKFKKEKIAYSKSESRTRHDVAKNKPSVYPLSYFNLKVKMG